MTIIQKVLENIGRRTIGGKEVCIQKENNYEAESGMPNKA